MTEPTASHKAPTPETWLAGNPEVASRVDPTIAAAIMAILQVVLALGLHTHLGIDTDTLFGVAMGIGMLVTIGRRVQVGRRDTKTPESPAGE